MFYFHSGGDKIPRKGGPGITQSDLLVINKTDLAEAVGADLEVGYVSLLQMMEMYKNYNRVERGEGRGYKGNEAVTKDVEKGKMREDK